MSLETVGSTVKVFQYWHLHQVSKRKYGRTEGY